MYAFICFDAENFEFFGTNDETQARLFARDHFAVQVATGQVLGAVRETGEDVAIKPLPPQEA